MVRRAQSDNHCARLRFKLAREEECGSFVVRESCYRFYEPPTRSFPMAAAKKSSRSKSGRKRSRSGSSGRKRGGAKKRATKRSSGSARKSPRRGGRKSAAKRKSSRRKSSSRKSSSRASGRKRGARKSSRSRSRRRSQSPVARVKRVASGVVHQAADLGERAVDTVTEFVQDRF